MLRKIIFAVWVATSSLAFADVTTLACAQTGPTEYKLSFSLTEGTREVQIFASADPTGKVMQPILRTSDSQVTVHAGKSGERMYFFLKPDKGEMREVSIRHLNLQGTPNFRDLGGYETTDGRFVRWGLLYRSGVLTNLTPSDLTYLGQLGVRVVCDFRTPQENADSPEKWIADPEVQHISVPIGAEAGKDQNVAMQQMFAGNPTPEQLHVRMDETYRRFVIGAVPQYSRVFRELQNDRLPLLYHCTAGKDRTGVFSALVLLSLGVPEKTVLEDYALTNKYLVDGANQNESASQLAHMMPKGLEPLSPEQLHAVMEANPEMLRSALKAINEKYGSFDNYRQKALGVSDSDLEKLRSRLLTN